MDFETPEDLFKKMNIKLPKLPNFGKATPLIVAIVIGVIILATGIYSTGPAEVGVITRFGKYVRTTEPGLHLKIPIIETVYNVPVKEIERKEFGFRTTKAGVVSQYSPMTYFDESLMLTGDLNVLIVEWVAQYRIKNAVHYLFNIRDPVRTIRNISEAMMRQVVGDYTVDEIRTKRDTLGISDQVKEKMQEILDQYKSGILITSIDMQDVNPPDEVKPSFNEVETAKQEKDKVINQAWEAYNKVIPRARGEAEKTIREAEGYALKRINTAKGDAAKFISIWEAYKSSKDVTRKRLYLEAMNEILPKVENKVIVDSSLKSILPLLNLNKGGAQ